MPIRITGLNSGLDTEALISELVSAYSTKKDKYVKAQTKLSWKQDAWKSLNSKVKTFYSSLDSLRFSNGYNLKSTTISDSSKATVKAGSKAVNGVQSLQITQLAKAGYLTGGKLSNDKSITADSKLSDLGYSGMGTITVNTGDSTTDVSVTADTKISDFVTSLNNAGVNVSFDEANQRMFVSAKETGKENDFSLVGSDSNGSDALLKLGLKARSAAGSAEYNALAEFAVSSFNSADGTTTPATTNASGDLVYDADATRNYVSYLLEKAKTSQSSTEDLTAANEVIQGQLSYLTNYESSQTVLDHLSDTEQTKLKSMINGDAYTYTDASGNETSYYVTATNTSSGTVYSAIDQGGNSAGTVIKNADGKFVIDGHETTTMSDETKAAQKKELEIEAGLVMKNEDGTDATDDSGNKIYDATTAAAFEKAYSATYVYETNDTLSQDQRAVIDAIKAAHTAGSTQSYADGLSATYNSNTSAITANNNFLKSISTIYHSGTDLTTTDNMNAAVDSVVSKIANAVTNVNTDDTDQAYSAGATRVDGQDAIIYLNDAQFTSASNTITVNDLTITATGVTGEYDATGESAVSVTTATDTQGLYDKIKDFLTSYNDIINEMTSLYNASSAKDYEPLTDDERSEMTDSQVEKWEEKIKDSLLRRDSTLGNIMSLMENAMAKSYEGADGKNYSLSSFGIQTLGYLNADANEQNAYHIYGDADDSATSSRTDKLMAALTEDPDSVISFMQDLTGGLHDSVGTLMKATSLRSTLTIYNDKEMAREYSDYTTTIGNWEDKVADMEDYYYKKFAAMESALATLQSSSSALSSLLS